MRSNPFTPLKLQFFAEEPPTTSAPPATPAQPAPQTHAQQTSGFTVDDLIKVLDTRTARAENNALKSIADQNGLTEAEMQAMFAEAKAKKAKALPEDAQKQIDAAKAEVQRMKIETALAKEGTALGLVDPDAALQLMPKDSVKVNDKGEVVGLKEALEALQKSKPYLFGKPAAMAQKVGGAGVPPEKTAHEEAREQMYKK